MQITYDNLPQAVSGLYTKLDLLEKLIRESGFSQAPAEDDILNIDQAAEHVGLSVATFYSHVHKRKVPHFKQGGRLYFSKQELTEWIKSGRRRTKSEIASAAKEHIKSSK